MHAALRTYLGSLDTDGIAPPRRQSLIELAGVLPAKLTFICTHNSRRSHFGQIWARTAAAFCDVAGIETFSGGTEATAFNPRAVAAIERAGFDVARPEGDNPRYVVRYASDAAPLTCFSKRWDDPSNPTSDFGAIMTCTEADRACPTITGADFRFALPYDDPKSSDGSPHEAATYDERCRQIATEMLFVMRQLSK